MLTKIWNERLDTEYISQANSGKDDKEFVHTCRVDSFRISIFRLSIVSDSSTSSVINHLASKGLNKNPYASIETKDETMSSRR